MTRAALAVHPQLRNLVLTPAALNVGDSIELRDLGDGPWRQGWLPDAAIEVLITGWGTPALDQSALEAMPNLRAVLHIGGTIRELITADVWTHGITVVSAAEVNNRSVADFVAAQTLLALKGAHRAAAAMQRNHVLPGPASGPGIHHQVVGLVSFGSVARQVADRLQQFGAQVIAWDPKLDDFVFDETGVRRIHDLPTLFESSTLVSIHAPLIPGVTEGLITGDLIERLPHGGVLINTARGAVVDEPSMIATLAERSDILAILDVTWPEPPEEDSPLYTFENVVLTGHTAGSVGSENQRMGEFIMRALADVHRGVTPAGVVTRAQSELRA